MSTPRTAAHIASESLPQWQLQDAKNRFSAVVKAAANGAAQVVTVHGVRAAVVLSPEVYDRLVAVKPPVQCLSEALLSPLIDDEATAFDRDRRHNPTREMDL